MMPKVKLKKGQEEGLALAKEAEAKSAEIAGSGITAGESFTANMPAKVLGG